LQGDVSAQRRAARSHAGGVFPKAGLKEVAVERFAREAGICKREFDGVPCELFSAGAADDPLRRDAETGNGVFRHE